MPNPQPTDVPRSPWHSKALTLPDVRADVDFVQLFHSDPMVVSKPGTFAGEPYKEATHGMDQVWWVDVKVRGGTKKVSLGDMGVTAWSDDNWSLYFLIHPEDLEEVRRDLQHKQSE